MNSALRKEMQCIRKGMLEEKDPESRTLMASMYREMYGQAFRDEEAERPMRLTKAFVRSAMLYLIFQSFMSVGFFC
jgi:hypothetical protein